MTAVLEKETVRVLACSITGMVKKETISRSRVPIIMVQRLKKERDNHAGSIIRNRENSKKR
jgi:hypothetical protein